MGAAFGHADPPGEGELFTTIRAFTRRLFTQRPIRNCPKRVTRNAPIPYLAIYGGRNGPKSTVSVSRKATQWARLRLFGQFLKTNSRNFACSDSQKFARKS